MRYISKHEADVYLDKERRKNTEQKKTKKKKPEDGGKEAFILQLWTSLVAAAVETESHFLHNKPRLLVSLFSIPHRENPEATSLAANEHETRKPAMM